MFTRTPLITILVCAMLLGCKSPVDATAAVNGANGDGAAPAPAGATRIENVPDTTMDNTTAFYVTVPAKWKFQGVLLQGGQVTCDSYAMLSWRAKSEDGRITVEQMPQQLWAYGNGPKPVHGCLPIDGPMSAQEFLKHLAAMMQLDYVSEDSVGDENATLKKQWQDADAKSAQFYASRNLSAPKNTIEVAAAIVRPRDGTLKGRLKTQVHCIETTQPGMKSMLRGMPDRPAMTTGKCTADVVYFSAPESQLASVVRQWDSPQMGPKQNQTWGDAWVKRYAAERQAGTDRMIGAADARFAAQRQEIAHTMAVQQQVHDQFLATMQRGTDISIARTYDAMNARSTAASDMVDYSLDRQTVMDTNTGTIYKITNQVTVGGALQPVHGNGTPY